MATDPFSSDFTTDFGATLAPVTGALSIIQSAHALNATGTLATIDNASLSVTQDDQQVVGYGGPTVAGSVSASQWPNTLYALGNVPLLTITGTLSPTQADQALSAQATADTSFHTATLSIQQDWQRIINPAVFLPGGSGEAGGTSVAAAPAIGTQDDMASRLRAVLPAGWFPDPDNTPILNGILAGMANTWSSLWSLMNYVASQKRISTATDINLDLISNDYLGTSLPRQSGESDDSYRIRIKASIFQRMATRSAISAALTQLTGTAPRIFEPQNANDTGGWGKAATAVGTGLGYGLAGGYGSYALPFQAFVQTGQYAKNTALGVQGYGTKGQVPASAIGGYGGGIIDYSLGSQELVAASDENLYNTINAIKPVATIIWVSTQALSQTPGQPVQQQTPKLDSTFVLDVSRLG